MRTDRVETNPGVMLGKPVVAGTRVPVELVLRKLGEGATTADLLSAYPRLTERDCGADSMVTRKPSVASSSSRIHVPKPVRMVRSPLRASR